jgi:excisionase family DNA binding protein
MLITTSEAAAYLKVKPETLAKWRSVRKGPKFYHVGGAVRYKVSDLEAFIEAEAGR